MLKRGVKLVGDLEKNTSFFKTLQKLATIFLSDLLTE